MLCHTPGDARRQAVAGASQRYNLRKNIIIYIITQLKYVEYLQLNEITLQKKLFITKIIKNGYNCRPSDTTVCRYVI